MIKRLSFWISRKGSIPRCSSDRVTIYRTHFLTFFALYGTHMSLPPLLHLIFWTVHFHCIHTGDTQTHSLPLDSFPLFNLPSAPPPRTMYMYTDRYLPISFIISSSHLYNLHMHTHANLSLYFVCSVLSCLAP